MTFGGHLDVLRKILIRILAVTLIFACLIFAFKDVTFSVLLSPSEPDFCTYRWLEDLIRTFKPEFSFGAFHIDLIATDLSSQFMTHITTSVYLGFVLRRSFSMNCLNSFRQLC